MVELSIVIPIYNVEEYLEECLKSIYALNINKEIILVNDESPDNSYKIIEKYKKLYFDETIIINQKNKGLSGARNSGLSAAKGKYIAFIDSDDFIDTKKYENFFNKGKKEELDIIIGTYQKYQDGKYLDIYVRNKVIENFGVISGKYFFEKSIELNSFKEEVWDDIYKREFLLNNNLKFKERLLHEDTLFFIQALIKAKKVKCYNIPIYIYRQREGSIMATSTYKNQCHKLYTINKLLELQENNERIVGLNSFLISMLWSTFINSKKVNIKILKKIIYKKEKYNLEDYLKIFIMLCGKIKLKEIEIANLEE